MDVRVHFATTDYVFATWERVAIGFWRGRTTPTNLRLAEAVLDEHAQRVSERVPVLVVITADAPLPTLEARIELAAMLARSSKRIERCAVVLEGDGFRAITKRALVSGVLLFARPAYPYRMLPSVGAAARFLSGGRNADLLPHLLIRAVRYARRPERLVAAPPARPRLEVASAGAKARPS